MVREMLPLAEIYVYEDDYTKQIDGFIGLNNDYIEGLFVKETMQSKGIGKQLINHVKKVKSILKLSVYQKNEKALHHKLIPAQGRRRAAAFPVFSPPVCFSGAVSGRGPPAPGRTRPRPAAAPRTARPAERGARGCALRRCLFFCLR